MKLIAEILVFHSIKNIYDPGSLGCGFDKLVHLTKGGASDQIERIFNNLPFANEKYGDS